MANVLSGVGINYTWISGWAAKKKLKHDNGLCLYSATNSLIQVLQVDFQNDHVAENR